MNRIVIGLAIVVAAAGCNSAPSPPAKVASPAPDSFRVAFETTRGNVVVEVKRAWSPKGVDRFYELVQEGFYDDAGFFRVIPGFIAQFGLNGDKKRNEIWDRQPIGDDPVVESNTRGTLTFAQESSPNTRSHQLFFNLGNNARLDALGFSPFGRVVEGMPAVDAIYDGYRERPEQHMITSMGNSYLRRMFPNLDYVKSAKIVK